MNKININRIIIPADIPLQKRIESSLALIVSRQEKANTTNAILITPTKRMYESSEILSHYIKINKKTWKSKLQNIRLSLETETTIDKKSLSYSNDVFVSYFPSQKMINYLDSLPNPKCIIVVADFSNNLEEWIDIWNPIIFSDNPSAGTLSEINLDDKVIKLLKNYILPYAKYDRSTLHTNDRDRTIFYFKYLKKHRMNYSLFEIKKFLLRNNSNVSATKEICSIGEGIKNGRKYQYKHYSNFSVELD